MQPIQLDLKPSILATALFTLMSLAALSIVILLDFSHMFNWSFNWQFKSLLSAMIIISAIYAILCHGLLLLPWSCVALKVSIKNELELVLKNGDIIEVVVQSSSVVSLYLTVLNSRIKNAGLIDSLFHQHHLIFFDAVNADDYRHLRVWLRWASCHSAAIKESSPL